jgi:hypothetical protein
LSASTMTKASPPDSACMKSVRFFRTSFTYTISAETSFELQETGIRRVKNCSLDYGRWVECPFQGLANSTTFRIQILIVILTQIWILFVTLMRIRIRIPASKWRLKTFKKYSNMLCSYSIQFGLSSANWCGSGSESSLKLWCGSGSRSYLSFWSGSMRIQIRIHNTASSKPLMSLGSRMTLLVCELPSYL